MCDGWCIMEGRWVTPVFCCAYIQLIAKSRGGRRSCTNDFFRMCTVSYGSNLRERATAYIYRGFYLSAPVVPEHSVLSLGHGP